MVRRTVNAMERYGEVVTLKEIAHRLGYSARTVEWWHYRKDLFAQRDPFPTPIIQGHKRLPSLWRWNDVLEWEQRHVRWADRRSA